MQPIDDQQTSGAGWAGLATGLVLFTAMLLADAPAGLPLQAWRTAACMVLMATWWITEAIPIPATALLPLALFPLLGVATIGNAASPYANPVIFLFLGGFVIARALERCGLHRRIALTVVGAVGTKRSRIIGGFMLATALLSMWVSNTATVVMMLPMALSVIAIAERDAPDPQLAVASLLGIAYAANIGGMGTLIGTPPNALLAGYMSETWHVEIGFGRWMLLGVPLVAISLPLVWLLLVNVLHPQRPGELAGGAAMIRDEIEKLGRLSSAEKIVGGITLVVAMAWITRPILERSLPGLSDAGIAIAGALLLFIVPVRWRPRDVALEWKDAESLPWSVLILFGGGLSLAAAIQETGLAGAIGGGMSGLRTVPPLVALIVVTAVVVFLTELTSNTATAAALVPIVAAAAAGFGQDPLTFALPVALAASCAFMLPVATPPNAVVYGSGRMTIRQMATAGLWVNFLMIALLVVAVRLAGTLLVSG
ncbi:MAG TPA: DASS family sodium-coupled anion symporter [Thermoanaerobaculia bacterium]|nr:DASS family sodium-coupled anion symporter [Thermoanaerobaculia bacterium]